ncbi:MAG: two-component sensor histidine kinase, partial [Duncaniella sp.]|nr:two-component sensor histidine kinase [Duncaniella sp.]
AENMKTIVTTAAIAILILLVFIAILFRLYRKNRELVRTLDKSNKALRAESIHLEKSKTDLLKARDQAQKANYMKTDFIKNMSYEVKAPLKAINEYCKLITDCSDASNKKYLERFSSLVELNSELLSTIINDVLHISEIDSDSVPVHNRSVELRPLCTMVLDGVRHRLSPGVALMFDAASPDISLFTDPQRVHQILLNLLTNAAKFTSKGSITLAYRVDNEKETVIFSVTDTGIGIKDEKREEIFERFVKLDKETQGAGLGLTISRLLARILGGDVVLDKSYTRGSRFLLILPKK